jgi:hypothetical protein
VYPVIRLLAFLRVIRIPKLASVPQEKDGHSHHH